LNGDGIRTFSGWKVFADSLGVPLSVTTGYATKGENLFSRARRINERRPEQVVIDLSFSVPRDSAAKYNLIIRQNSTTLLTLPNLSNIPNSVSDIRTAVNSVNLIQNVNLVFKREQNGFNLYNVYTFTGGFINTDNLVAVLEKTGDKPIEAQIGVCADSSYQNINSTVSALACMADNTPDLFYQGTISPISDSVKIKLLVTAMVDMSLPHNSPITNSFEASQGIFTNYMQFMDNIAGNWNSIRSITRGIPRLQAIHNRVLEQNRNVIIDPVEIKNHGTSFEPDQFVQERKNYVYTIGFSRINWEIEKPDYNTSLSGTGLMFRISNNIALYRAKTKNVMPVFDTLPFLSGNSGRRFIFRMNDTIVNIINNDSDGVWIKALSDTGSEQFYSGIVPVRLPIKLSGGSSPVKIDTGFSLPNESSSHDPIGTIIKGAEKNLLKLYVLNENKGRTDTLSNVTDPNMILHGQKRRVVVDSSYFSGKRIQFSLQTANVDRNKMYFIDSSKYSLTMVDTSFFVKPWTLLAVTVVTWKGKEKVVQTIGLTGHNGKICLKDAYNGDQFVWAGRSDTFAIAVETDSNGWIKAGNGAFVDIKTVKGSARIFKRKACSVDDEIVDLIMWSTFKDSVLHRDSIYVVCKDAGESVIELSIGGSGVKNAVRERLVINRVSMKLCDTLGRDLSLQANAFSPKRIISQFSSNPYDTARIRLYGLIFPEAQDTVSNVKIEILYDTTNSDHVQFYAGTTGPNRVVKTLNASNAARAENVSVKWDGRDSANNRILIEGKFLVKTIATTVRNKSFTIFKNLYMAKPVLVSLGPYHTLTFEELKTVDTLKAWDKRNLIVWDSVPFLAKNLHSSFNWVFNPNLSMGLVGGCNGYKPNRLNGGIGAESLIDSLRTGCSVFHITGHHRMMLEPGNRYIGNYLIAGERQSLVAECGSGSAGSYCSQSDYCLNRKCNDSLRGVRILDDVVLAVLVGCATDTGTVSTAQAFLDQGVDCVIGTQRLAVVEIMNFWNYYFWDYVNGGQTINNAAINAYTKALDKYMKFLKYNNEIDVYEHFGKNPDGTYVLRGYDETMQVRGYSNDRLKPAHYGVKQ